MYAMQYTVALPADYDMQIIRDRVTSTGHLIDGFPGLEFKAYLIQERNHGAPRNAYAPFYVWRDIDGMRSFCWGRLGFSSIVRDFGRAPIADWTVAALSHGPARYADAKSLRAQVISVPDGMSPADGVSSIVDPHMADIGPTTVARLAAIDVTSWTAVLIDLSTADLDTADLSTEKSTQHAVRTSSYEVLHVSHAADEPQNVLPPT
ncbi:DUF4865 family protein [Gordonia shandongensis]|uniref:DUF4865 family protein n=1 Tax=Gordonia shandongensis TaxID=376351 RepID=UPI0004227043|nr:DUF4865 family protein [Gordonia shandongensis]